MLNLAVYRYWSHSTPDLFCNANLVRKELPFFDHLMMRKLRLKETFSKLPLNRVSDWRGGIVRVLILHAADFSLIPSTKEGPRSFNKSDP